MLTGKRVPLQGREPVAATGLESIIATCLEKDPEERWQSARDVKRALDLASPPAAHGSADAPPRAQRFPAGWVVAAAACLVALIALLMLWRRPAVEERPVVFQIAPPPGTQFVLGATRGSAISPDGRAIAFTAFGGIPPQAVDPEP
jgi:hypothetical protein